MGFLKATNISTYSFEAGEAIAQISPQIDSTHPNRPGDHIKETSPSA